MRRTISLSDLSGKTWRPILSRVADDGEQVGVARALAIAVGGALDVHRTGLDRCEGVGDSTRGVVLAVDAELKACTRSDARHDSVDSAGQHPTVRVTQDANLGACVRRDL